MWPKLQCRNTGPVLVRDEYQPFGVAANIVYLSDFHFRAGSTWQAQVLAGQLRQLQPALILLGGDYADTPGGLLPFARFVREAAAVAPVVAVAGNHDWLYRRTLPGLVREAGGHWLADGYTWEQPLTAGYALHIAAPGALPIPATTHRLRVLCAHRPPDFRCQHLHYDVLLAGHLHGGQVVLWQRHDELYPGRWLYRYNGLRYRQGNSQLFVSRGLADTLPMRYNCPRELVRVRLSPAGLD